MKKKISLLIIKMSFFGRVLNKSQSFGKMLQGGVSSFGRMIDNGASRVAKGIQGAEKIVGKAEKYVGNVPILGGAVKAIGSGLKTAENITSLAGTIGKGASALATGNIQGVKQAYQTGKAEVGAIKEAGLQTLKQGAGVAGSIAML
jgi:hypothetical protein